MMRNSIILYATILQLTTSVFIFTAPHPIQIARLGLFYELFKFPQIGAVLMFVSVILAIHAMFLRQRGSMFYFLFFIPQLFFLLLTSGSALYFVFVQHYADGILRPWPFIFLDQLPAFVATLLYSFAIFDFKEYKI